MQRRPHRTTNINEKYINVTGNQREGLEAAYHARQGLEKLQENSRE